MSGEVRLRSEDLEWREVEEEVVALDLRTSSYLVVNRTGAAIWPALCRGASTAELICLVSDSFDVDPGTASTDVTAFLARLRQRGMLEQ